MEVISATRWALHGPVNATFNLGRCGVESMHYMRKNKYSNRYQKLLDSDVPDIAMLVRDAAPGFQALSANEQDAIVAFLLSRRPMAQALAAGFIDNTPARNVLMQAYLAYNGDPANPAANPGLTEELKAKVDAYLVTNCGVHWGSRAKGAFVPGSAYYNLLPATQRNSVNRILRTHQPGSKEYEELYKYNKEAWKIVRSRIETKEKSRDATRSLMLSAVQLCKFLPVPVIGGLIGDWIKERVGPRYPDFDPDRKEKCIEIKTKSAIEEKIQWELEQIYEGALKRVQELEAGARPKADGSPGDYANLGTYLADETYVQDIRRMSLNKEGDMGNATFQMQHSIQKIYAAFHDIEKYIDEDTKEMIKTGKDERTIYREAFGILLGKMMGESWECEPIINGGRFANGSVF